ncbi:hypothetical protein AMTRI_Chr11g151280 [Amborella trichopoda]
MAEAWLTFLCVSLSVAVSFIFFFLRPKAKKTLPPGPPSLPIIGNHLLLRGSGIDIELALRKLPKKYGPVFTLRLGGGLSIFVATRAVAHQALVQQGAKFADRPPAPPVSAVFTSQQHNISAAPYGPLWRVLRRNLMSETLIPARVKAFAPARQWAVQTLIEALHERAREGPVCVIEAMRLAVFSLLLSMCFGERFGDEVVKKAEAAQRRLLLSFSKFTVFALFPRIGKFIFRKLWQEVHDIKHQQEEVLLPLIRGAAERQTEFFSYADSLAVLELPDGRKLSEEEMLSLCSEFLNGGTDTTSTTLQWVMANLVKHPDVQAKVYEEIEKEGGVDEEKLQRMPYLKAVVTETLRLHPPGHFVLQHTVTEDSTLEGFVIPKGAGVNFMVKEMGVDPEAWEEPLEFRPERFLGGLEVDLTGSREIKMMPFGVGRRICPGMALAMMHLQYFVGHLVKEFEWKSVDGEEVDLSEKAEFTVVMRNPLKPLLIPRPTSTHTKQN